MRLHGLSRRGFTAGSYLITLGTATRIAWSRRTILIPSPEREGIERSMQSSIGDEFIIESRDNSILDAETIFIFTFQS